MTASPGDDRESIPPHRRGRIPPDTFANRLILSRALAEHISIREAAERTGLDRGAWQGWERGRTPRDVLHVAHCVAIGLDIDEEWLLRGGALRPSRAFPLLANNQLTVRPGNADHEDGFALLGADPSLPAKDKQRRFYRRRAHGVPDRQLRDRRQPLTGAELAGFDMAPDVVDDALVAGRVSWGVRHVKFLRTLACRSQLSRLCWVWEDPDASGDFPRVRGTGMTAWA